jgi:hypothetical protein
MKPSVYRVGTVCYRDLATLKFGQGKQIAFNVTSESKIIVADLTGPTCVVLEEIPIKNGDIIFFQRRGNHQSWKPNQTFLRK